MRKLLSANLNRLLHSSIFYIEIGSVSLLSLLIVLCNYSPELQATENRLYLDDVFFTMYQILAFLLAAGISLFVGTEYSDGTIRNKLAVGSTRAQIYFSCLVTGAVPSCIALLLHGFITYGVGVFLFGSFRIPAGQIVVALTCALLVVLVFSALFVAIAINCPSKAVTAVSSLLLVLGLLYGASAVGNILSEPEMTYSSVTISVENGVQFGELIYNTAYVTGIRRTILEYLYDLLPTGQLLQMYSMDFARCARWPVFSVALFMLITTAGYALFRKKDIK